MPERVYANDDFYSGQTLSGGGSYGGNEENPYGAALQPVPDAVPEPDSQAEPTSGEAPEENVDPGLLMSFLTDFRTAQYEEARRQRMEALEKSRKGRAHRPVPPVEAEPVDEADQNYDAAYEADEQPPESQWAPPAEHPVDGQPLADDAGRETEADAGFQVAACRPEEPAGKKRFRLGLPGFKDLGQSPATA